MKQKLFITTFIILIQAAQVTCAEEIQHPTAQNIISQWFSIDSQYDINMQKSLLSEDESQQKFTLSFTSDDQQKVNGILAVPTNHKEPLKLAVLMHAMGSNQKLWWTENKISGNKISKKLLDNNYAILTLDARRHGQRSIDDLGPKDMIKKAHSKEPRLYTDMIIGTVRDYRLALNWVKQELQLNDTDMLVAGYSMGAQMSLLLASYEHSINQVIVMVPPYVSEISSPVAPRLHVNRIKSAQTLFLAAQQDPYSSQAETQLVFDYIGSAKKTLKWFDSGHLLPNHYHQDVLSFIENLKQ